jgi:hypothetical protein
MLKVLMERCTLGGMSISRICGAEGGGVVIEDVIKFQKHGLDNAIQFIS